MTVVNIKREFCDVYVGRKKGTLQHYGNPFSHLPDSSASVRVATREEAVLFCEQWLRGDPRWKDVEPLRRAWVLDNLRHLKGKRLGCFCKPLACHGDVLERLSNHRPWEPGEEQCACWECYKHYLLTEDD